MISGDDESGVVVDANVLGGLDEAAQLAVLLGKRRREIRTLGAFVVAEDVEPVDVDGQEVRDCRR